MLWLGTGQPAGGSDIVVNGWDAFEFGLETGDSGLEIQDLPVA